MPYVTKEALDVLIPSLVTCGGDVGMLYGLAKALAVSGEGELWNALPRPFNPQAEKSVLALEAEAQQGAVVPESVIRRYGLPKHFHEMQKEAEAKVPSVAGEIPAEIRAIAHTLLPVKDGVYTNEGRIITLKGLVPLGEQKGYLVAHLSGVFSSGCTKEEIERLLAEQASDMEFLIQADKVGTIDYTGTKLQEFTLRAKTALNL